MRQIKFRGLTKDGKWVYGWYFGIWEEAYILWGTTNDVPNMTEVIPETVSESTGLKDKNGKEIYEGDIVEFDVVNMIWDKEKHEVKEHRPETWRRVVEWAAPKFVIHWCPEKMEVIGNIHENKKLLEKQ